VALFLAGKTNNMVHPLDDFITRFAKLKREDIVDLEFTVIQKLKFDVYVQRLGSALHGWFLKMQVRRDSCNLHPFPRSSWQSHSGAG
jgi:hypothetical protein